MQVDLAGLARLFLFCHHVSNRSSLSNHLSATHFPTPQSQHPSNTLPFWEGNEERRQVTYTITTSKSLLKPRTPRAQPHLVHLP